MSQSLYRRVIAVAIPVAIQNLIISSINMADVFMIGQLGEVPIAALGMANQIMFLLILTLFGVNSGSQVFSAQFFGAKDFVHLRRILGISLTVGLAAGLFFFITGVFFPEYALSIFTPEKDVVAVGARYLKIVAWSFPFTAVAFSYSFQLRSTDRPRLPMYVSMLALVINISLNWVLIFGNLGFPKLGIEGAAIATVIARVIETIAIIVMTHVTKSVNAARFSEMFSYRKELIKRYMKTSFPVFLNEITWAVGMAMNMMVFGRMGTQAMAAINIEASLGRLSFAGIIGISHAAAAVLGQELGAGRLHSAWKCSKYLVGASFVLGLVTSLFLWLLSPFVLSLYNISPELRELSYSTILVWCLFLPLVSFNALNIIGILRSGGDVKVALFIDIGGLWLLSVPLAVWGGLYAGLPVYFVYALARTDEIFKMIFGMWRYLTKKWLKNLVSDMVEMEIPDHEERVI